MQTECSTEPSMFGRVEGRPVVAEFDGGALTSDAGGLLLGAADRSLDLVRRLAGGIVRLNSSQTYLKFQRRSAAARSCVGYRRLLRLCVRERQCHPIRTPHE